MGKQTRLPRNCSAQERLDHFSEPGRQVPHIEGRCVEWVGNKDKDGYGVVFSQGVRFSAHRFSWLTSKGPIPAETPCVLHRCDVPACINPGHLFLGTIADNNADMAAKKRQVRGSRQHLARLTDELALEIYRAKGTGRVLAARYGVSQITISDIKRRATWAHIHQ